MATTQTVTERTRQSHGVYIRETGVFTATGTSDLQIPTKLKHIVWARISSAGASATNNVEMYLNSDDNAGHDQSGDGGIIHIESNIAAELHMYEAIGVG